MNNAWPLLPQLLLAAGGTLIFCLGAFWRRGPREIWFALAWLTAGAAGLAAIWLPAGETPFFGFDLSAYGRYFTFLFAAITALTLLFLRPYAARRGFAGDEVYGLLLFAALGMSLVAGARHWLIFFLGLEVLSLCLYVLIAIHKEEAGSSEAGLKYFIMGAVASAILTFGLALLYAATGTLEIGPSLAPPADPADLPLVVLALALLLVGIGFKISLVPFHLWTPDVYQGAPAPITAFLSTGSKLALFAVLIQMGLNAAAPIWRFSLPALWGLAVLTMMVGNLTALAQTQVKRLLAYSSVAQMGYLFMTLLAVKSGGLPALLFYLAVYAVMDLGAFGVLGTFSAGPADLDKLEDLHGLGYSKPWRAALFALCLISLAGLPPTAGFMGKLILFKAVLNAQFVWLAVIGIFTVIISIYVYFKVVVSLYMRPADGSQAILTADPGSRLAGAAIFILILWLGLNPAAVLTLIDRIVSRFSMPL